MDTDNPTRNNPHNVRRAVYLYDTIARKQRELDRAENDLLRHLATLSPVEFDEYAKLTMEIDRKRG